MECNCAAGHWFSAERRTAPLAILIAGSRNSGHNQAIWIARGRFSVCGSRQRLLPSESVWHFPRCGWRSYWALDVFRGNLTASKTLQLVSSNGRWTLLARPRYADSQWHWISMTDADIEQTSGIRQLLEERQAVLKLLESQRSMLRDSQSSAALSSQINQLNVQFEVVEAEMTAGALKGFLGNSDRTLLLVAWQMARNKPPFASTWGFGVKRYPIGWAVAFPHWLPVLLSAILSVALGVRPRVRYGLRTFLIATTIIAVLLGILLS